MSGEDARDFARLGVIAGYALGVLALDDLHLGHGVNTAITLFITVTWLALLADLVRMLIRARPRRRAIREHVGYVFLLIAPVFIGPDLQWGVLLLVLVGFLLELRRIAAGRAVAFSFGLVVFVGLTATFAMVAVERGNPSSQLGDVGEASAWTVSTLLRLPGFRPEQPVTSDGRMLTVVVGACAVLAASFFTAQLITWIIGSRRDEGAERDTANASIADLTTEVTALRACIDELSSRLDTMSGPPRITSSEANEDARTPEG